MYESKKQSAQRTIEKKDSKLQEIETVRSSFKFVFWLQYTAHGEIFFHTQCTCRYMVLIYVVISVILRTINNEAFDVQCGSIECVQLKFFFLTFISDMKLTTQSNSFLYRYRYNVSIFSDFGWGNNTNIDQAERGTFTMYKKSCYYVHFLAQNHLIAKHLMFQELSW